MNKKFHREGNPEIVIKPIDDNLEDENLMEMVNAGLLPSTIVERPGSIVILPEPASAVRMAVGLGSNRSAL